jgi:hypothetical protein
MVDGVFSRAFRSSLKPIELGRRLVKEMDAHRTLDVHGRAIVPNVYRFTLSPADHHAFSSIEGPLVRELIDAAKEHARDEGYGLLGPLRVVLSVDETLRSGRLGLASEMSAQSRPAPGVAAPAARPAPAAAAAPVVAAPVPVVPAVPVVDAGLEERPAWTADPLSWASGPHDAVPADPGGTATVVGPGPATVARTSVLVLATGQVVPLEPGRTATVGRLPSCEVLLNDPNVSRRHCEVRPQGSDWVLADLGSTNGSRVNGSAVGEHVLRDGDVITIGGTRLRYEVR